MEILASNLKIGFDSEVKVIERNTFEITGDIIMKANLSWDAYLTINKLRVIYNHDGLLDHVYNGQDTPDNLLLFKDVEMYVNSSWEGKHCIDSYDCEGVSLSEDRAIEVYADFYLG